MRVCVNVYARVLPVFRKVQPWCTIHSENVHTYKNVEMLSPLFFKSHTDLILRYQSAEVGI